MEMVQKKEDILEFLKQNKTLIARKYHVKEIGLFGSFIHNEHQMESDIDILISLKTEGKTFRNYMRLKFYLEDNFHRKVDLVTKSGLKEIIRDRIEKETIYA